MSRAELFIVFGEELLRPGEVEVSTNIYIYYIKVYIIYTCTCVNTMLVPESMKSRRSRGEAAERWSLAAGVTADVSRAEFFLVYV